MRFNRLVVLTIALTCVAWTALELRGQERELPDAIQYVLESLDIDHEHANVEVNIEREDGRTEIHIIVEPAGQEHRHDDDEEHDGDDDEEHGDWERELHVKARAIEEALLETNTSLEHARSKLSEEHPKVRMLKEEVHALEIVMLEIESKLEHQEEEHAEQDHEEMEGVEGYHIRIREIEAAMAEKEMQMKEAYGKYLKKHPVVLKLRREMAELERALKENMEGLEEAEHEAHEAEHEDEEDEVVEELFERLDGLDDRMHEIEEQLHEIIGLLKDR